ncbi:unnamed protein product [Leptosia nina]|uniref:Odorant receptor n=1 Tax=Leptosia nina TaxID=320188 RepID=A0AAV1JLH7_9NEOP
MVENVGFLLRAATVNIDKRNLKPIPIIFYVLTIIGYSCYYYVYLISVLWFVFVHYPQTGDYVATIIVFSLGAFTETCPIKLLFMVINRNLIADVVERYLICDGQVNTASRFSKNIRKHLRVVKKRGTIIWLTLMINAYIHCLTPLFLPGRHFPEDEFILYGLEPMRESPNFEVATAMFTISISTGVYSLANGTAFMVMLFGYTEAQIISLSEELLNVWSDAEKEYENVVDIDLEDLNAFIATRLKFIARMHVENITLIKQIENVLRVSMALEFLFLMAGLIAAMLGGIANTYLEIPFALVQIFMSCYLGQKIINSSETFEVAIYGCKWENFNKSNMTTVLIMLQNSQKTLKLSAGGVAILSFECLMSVMKSCYSFYTTLQSTIK